MYSVGIAYLLWLFSGCGALGLHRFYLRKIPTGILWMCTIGMGMVGAVYDFFTLPRQVQEANIRDALFGRERPNPAWRNIHDGEARFVRSGGRPGGLWEKESVERIILKLAKQNRGILTASEVALEANIPMEDAKRDLDALVSKGFAEIRVRKSGVLVYTLPELMDQDSPLEDF